MKKALTKIEKQKIRKDIKDMNRAILRLRKQGLALEGAFPTVDEALGLVLVDLEKMVSVWRRKLAKAEL